MASGGFFLNLWDLTMDFGDCHLGIGQAPWVANNDLRIYDGLVEYRDAGDVLGVFLAHE